MSNPDTTKPPEVAPRDCIISYIAVLDEMRNTINLDYGKMADALIHRLNDAGFLIVPKEGVKQ